MFRQMLLTIALIVTIGSVSAQEARPWRVGVAKTAITPAEPMWMSGYASRDKPAQGKVHDLWAKALVLEDAAGKRCVLVSLDLVGIDRVLADEIAADLKKHHGFERDQVMLSVSHTHCGPVVGRNLLAMYNLDAMELKKVFAYADDLHAKVVQVVGVAVKDLQPAQITWKNGYTTFATNRRTNKETEVPKMRALGKLNGPVDHEVPVLCVRAPDGKVRAIAFGYACHATVLSFYQWCGDYPGFAQAELEKRYPGATALFHAGCGADQTPLPRRSVALAEGYGKQLAEAVDQVVKAPMTPIKPLLKTTYARIDLPFGVLPTREKVVQDTMSKNHYIAARAKMLLADFEKAGALKKTYPYPVQTWQLGNDLTWIALGGEVVVDYSVRLKKELGKVWVTGYANDVMAYIPSLKVLKEGGYEGDSSMIYYGQPCAWGPRVEAMIVEAVHGQVGAGRRKQTVTP
ncbi:MAG: neutral/alkaline non-lysosomal ceramidase N-terminal domain-containing protein [Planctomycetes bacterium]|nr:neutral/alkaline non-lysosomal ceramidase N-terminal domain-containing protein [Planctomycetota bacterium]